MAEANLKEILANSPAKDKWEKVGYKKRAGVLVPLFAVYSQDSLGIGDFRDLKLLIDWAIRIGNSIVQLLPMNEVGSTFCPYDSLSSFALEPVYICLEQLVSSKTAICKDKLETLKKSFPAGKKYVDYRIKQEKIKILWEIYLEKQVAKSKDFQKFVLANQYWLEDFSLFKVIKKHQQGVAWYEWPGEYKNRDKVSLEDSLREYKKEIIFEKWLQWQAYKQFKEVKDYANKKGILIKGDLPILPSRDSAEVWAHPEFFKLEYAAGAPPDMYCSKGQRWGTPTYNWEAVSSDGYKYLKEKLKLAEAFYDILRIDHVVGLFRIWSIPYNDPPENQGLNGAFDPKDEKVWGDHGYKILSVILESTNMLLCAEDLGVIPKSCTQTLADLGIPGNDVQRWVKDWNKRHDFLSPEEYRLLSVAVLSTHDTTNWPAWWENEAGTVDEALFMRRCAERRIDFSSIKDKLFATENGAAAPVEVAPYGKPHASAGGCGRVDLSRSRRGRLRWLNSIDSVEKLVSILGKKKEEVMDFIDFYENSFQEKEKLWKRLGISGPMREKSDKNIVQAIIKLTLQSRSVFCIQLITDYLYLNDILQGDSYNHRINTPGTVSDKNWSLVMPIPLDKLLKHPLSDKIKEMIVSSGRLTSPTA